jgi:hypothetical protein
VARAVEISGTAKFTEVISPLEWSERRLGNDWT